MSARNTTTPLAQWLWDAALFALILIVIAILAQARGELIGAQQCSQIVSEARP